MIEPYFETDNGKLYHGDCLDVMKDIPDESLDLFISSPPFNLGNSHHTGTKKHSPYEDNLTEDSYQKWQSVVIDTMYNICKNDGSLFYQHKNRIKNGLQITPYEWLLSSKWITKQELIWFNRSQNFDKIRFYPMTERVYWLSKSTKTQFKNHINHHDFFTWRPEGTKKDHTRAYPIALVADILNCFPSNVTVIDPFMGSGTTAIACERLNRRWIGIEISQDYCDIAVDRIKKETAQFKLEFT